MNSDEDLDALAARIAAEPRVFVRLAPTKPTATWEVRAFEVTLGIAPQSWQRRLWSYPKARLLSSARHGTTVAEWIRSRRIEDGRGATAHVDGLSNVGAF